MNPASLPWWLWLLTGALAALAAGIAYLIANSETVFIGWRRIAGFIFFVAAVSSVGALLIGIIRFVKWAWSG